MTRHSPTEMADHSFIRDPGERAEFTSMLDALLSHLKEAGIDRKRVFPMFRSYSKESRRLAVAVDAHEHEAAYKAIADDLRGRFGFDVGFYCATFN